MTTTPVESTTAATVTILNPGIVKTTLGGTAVTVSSTQQAPTAATLTQLEQLRQVLAGFGVTDISSLPPLSVPTGNITPMAGLLTGANISAGTNPGTFGTGGVPVTPITANGTTALFNNASQIIAPTTVTTSAAAPLPPATVQSISGTSKVLPAQPHPATLTVTAAPTAAGTPQLLHSPRLTQPQNTAYWAGPTINIPDNTNVILMNQNAMSLTIVTPSLTIGQNVTFTWALPMQNPAGAPDAAGTAPAQPAPPMNAGGSPSITYPTGTPATPNMDLSNGVGGAGSNGTTQNPGNAGNDGPDITIWTLQMNGSAGFCLNGQDGTPGGAGQAGGPGGQGANGGAAVGQMIAFVGNCLSGPGPGRNGGAGGNGATGGQGGAGGAGGSLTLYIPNPQTLAPSQLYANVLGGNQPAAGITGSHVVAGGEGYAVGDTGNIQGGNQNATYQVMAVTGSGAVSTFYIIAGGSGYQLGNATTTSGGEQPGHGTGLVVGISILSQLVAPGGPGGAAGLGGSGGAVGSVPSGTGCSTNLSSYPAPPRVAGAQGANGSAGAKGAPGVVGAVGTLTAYAITTDAFDAEMTAPVITTLTLGSAQLESVVIAGLRLSSSDLVYTYPTGGSAGSAVRVSSTFISATQINFTFPSSTPGGVNFVFVQRSDGTQSNKVSFELLPFIGSASPAGFIKPGSTVTLTGSGFAPGVVVQTTIGTAVQEFPTTYVGPGTLTFTLNRPAGITPSEFGEPVSVQVKLPTGDLSNTLALTLATFRIAALGDSIMWGQGLLADEKFSTLVQTAVENKYPAAHNNSSIGTFLDVMAHSGATLGVSDPTSGAATNGEVPNSNPTVVSQIGGIASPATVDLVLLDGGINDVQLQTILSPLTSGSTLASTATKFCQMDMTTLLIGRNPGNPNYSGPSILSTFPNARIVVTGYYPILSSQSDTTYLLALLTAIGFIAGGPFGPAFTVLSAVEISNMVSNCGTFAKAANTGLQAAVNAANQGASAPRVFFAAPPFGAANSLFTPTPWVWGLNGLSPEDPVAATRAPFCTAAFPGAANAALLGFCERASVGHPNMIGAQEYADAITPIVTETPGNFAGSLVLNVAGTTVSVPNVFGSFIFTGSDASQSATLTQVTVPNFSVAVPGSTTESLSIQNCVVTPGNPGTFTTGTGALTGIALSFTATVTPIIQGSPVNPPSEQLTINGVTLTTAGGSARSSTGAITLAGSGTATGTGGDYIANGNTVAFTLTGNLGIAAG